MGLVARAFIKSIRKSIRRYVPVEIVEWKEQKNVVNNVIKY